VVTVYSISHIRQGKGIGVEEVSRHYAVTLLKGV